MKTTVFFLLLVIIQRIGLAQVLLEPVLDLTERDRSKQLTNEMMIFEDKRGLFSLSDIVNNKTDTLFKVNDQFPPNKGYSAYVYWIRINMKNSMPNPRLWLLEIDYPNLDYVTFYKKNMTGDWLDYQVGDKQPFNFRSVKYRNPVFRFVLNDYEQNTIYIRIQSSGALTFPITIWEPEAFRNNDHETQIVFGIYYGLTIGLILYNLLLFFSIRDKNYLYYVGYIGAYLIVQASLNGVAFEYLWPDYPVLNDFIIPLSISAALFMVIQFSVSFLKTEIYTPGYYHFLTMLRISCVIIGVMTFFIPYRLSIQLAAICAIIIAPSVVISAWIALKNNYRPARYFLIAWSVLLIGMLMLAFKNFGILPNNFITNYSVQIGSFLEVLLLSLALADRINLLTDELEIKEKEKQRLAEERFSLARQITIGILHQIRQPLQVLKGNLDLISLSGKQQEKESEKFIEKSVTSVDKIDQHLKELEKIQLGELPHATKYTRDETMIDLSGQHKEKDE